MSPIMSDAVVFLPTPTGSVRDVIFGSRKTGSDRPRDDRERKFEERVGRERSVERHDTRIHAREFEIARTDALVKGGIFALETIDRDVRGRRTRGHTRARHFDWDVDQKREIGHASTRCRLDERGQRRVGEAAAEALIGERRIDVAIAEHPRTARERGLDHVVDELRARRVDDEGLGQRREHDARLDECRAQEIAERRATGFARRDDVRAARLECRREAREERRFAAPLDTLNRDEPTGIRSGYADAPVP